MRKSKIIFSQILLVGLIATSGVACAQKAENKTTDAALHTETKKMEKRIEVNEENGEKTVTVTTIENGKETTKTYKGEEADAFLKEQDNGLSWKSDDGDIDIRIEAGDMNSDEIQKKIDELVKVVEAEAGGDGDTKVKIRIMSDSDAEIDLDKLEDELDIDIDVDGDGTKKKVIVKKIVIEEDEEKDNK